MTSHLPVTGPIASELPQLRRSLKWYELSELEAGYESQHYECVGSGIDQIITTLTIVTLDTWSGRTYIFPLTDSGLPWHAAARDSLLGPRRRESSHSPGVTTAQLEELVTEERERERERDKDTAWGEEGRHQHRQREREGGSGL